MIGTQAGQKPGGKNWDKVRGKLLPPGLPLLACSTYFPIHSRAVTPYSVVWPFPSIINQENDPQACPIGQSDKGIFSAKVLSSQMTIACVKITTKLTNTGGLV